MPACESARRSSAGARPPAAKGAGSGRKRAGTDQPVSASLPSPSPSPSPLPPPSSSLGEAASPSSPSPPPTATPPRRRCRSCCSCAAAAAATAKRPAAAAARRAPDSGLPPRSPPLLLLLLPLPPLVASLVEPSAASSSLSPLLLLEASDSLPDSMTRRRRRSCGCGCFCCCWPRARRSLPARCVGVPAARPAGVKGDWRHCDGCWPWSPRRPSNGCCCCCCCFGRGGAGRIIHDHEPSSDGSPSGDRGSAWWCCWRCCCWWWWWCAVAPAALAPAVLWRLACAGSGGGSGAVPGLAAPRAVVVSRDGMSCCGVPAAPRCAPLRPTSPTSTPASATLASGAWRLLPAAFCCCVAPMFLYVPHLGRRRCCCKQGQEGEARSHSVDLAVSALFPRLKPSYALVSFSLCVQITERRRG